MLNEQIIDALAQLVKEGGAVAIWVTLILELKCFLWFCFWIYISSFVIKGIKYIASEIKLSIAEDKAKDNK